MPEQRGECTNTANCTLAQEGRLLTVSGEFRCPECGTELRAGAVEKSTVLFYSVVALIWTAVLVGAIALGWKLSRESTASLPKIETSDAPPASVKPASSVVTDAERQVVLQRIDQMPNVSAANKERLYAYVERAQNLNRLMSVSFAQGGTRLTEAAIRKIVEESRGAAFARQARDPAVVFVVLGYADKKGDEKKNLQVSLDRAGHVMDILRKRCGVQNVVQTVPMGSSELFNAKEAAANRVVEVWALLP
jgi:outer membrane protein OmpA-like peptidoglycan-associated protein